MGSWFRWIKYIYEWCRDFALKGAGVGGGMPHGSFGGPVGNVWYVNGNAVAGVLPLGADTNPGTKRAPFETIAHAIAQCIADHDDYIICWNTYNQDTFPIHVTQDSIHIIGVAGPNGSWPALDATAVDEAVFIIDGGVENCEIAGFNIAGGALHAGIELSGGTNMTWIHHCTFGQDWFGPSQDGIRSAAGGGSIFNGVIEDCWFYGSDGPNGKLTRYGITNLAYGWGQWTIRRNYFDGLPTQAIDLGAGGAAHEFVIEENVIGCEDTDNIAIQLGHMAHYCMVANNKAQNGKDKMGQNPYGDAATDNHWMCNQVGIEMKYPDIAMG